MSFASRCRRITELCASWIVPLAAAIAAASVQAQENERSAALDEIVVTSSMIPTPRRQVGTAVSVMDAAEIELRGYETLADLLRTLPSISVSNAGGPGKVTTLRIRGEDAFRTMLIVDGVKTVDPSATQVAPAFDSLLVTGDLARVEVLRGPQGFLYGADAGGVVNVLTRRGRGPAAGRVDMESGTYGTRRADASLAGGNEQGDYFVSATRFSTDGFNSQSADTVLKDADGAHNTTLHAKLGWEPTERLRLQLVAHDVDASTQFDGCFSPSSFATTNDCVGTTRQTTYKVSADQSAGDFTNTVGLSDVAIARENFADGADAFGTRGELDRLEYTGSFKAAPTTTLVYGVDLQRERVTSGQPSKRDQGGYYFEYQGQLGDLFVSAGARYDATDGFDGHTSSRLSLAYLRDLGGGRSLKYRASLGTGFRVPSLYEMAYNGGPFALPPAAGLSLAEESSRGYDLGMEYDTLDGIHAEITYFNQRIDDELFFDLVGFSGYLQSPGTSRSRGVELAARVPFGERWRLVANWTHNRATDASRMPRLRRPRDSANLGLLYGADAGLRFAANYRLSRGAIDVGEIPLDDYAVLDVSVDYSISRTVEIYARVENATDARYRELIGYNTAGRAGYAGVRLRF